MHVRPMLCVPPTSERLVTTLKWFFLDVHNRPADLSIQSLQGIATQCQSTRPGRISSPSRSAGRDRCQSRLAQDYIMDSDASVKVVVGLDIEYGKKESRKATLSVWRTCVVHITDGDELQAVKVFADQVNYIL